MLSSCRLVQSPPYAFGSDASYIQVLSATDDAPGGEERRGGKIWLQAPGWTLWLCTSWCSGLGLQLPGTSPTDTSSSVCTGDPAAWLCSSSACVLYWQERQRPAKVFPLLGSDQQGASLVEGILRWKFTVRAHSVAWTEQGGWTGSEYVCRYTLNALNLETTFTKVHPLTAAQEVIVLVSNSTHYLPTESSGHLTSDSET